MKDFPESEPPNEHVIYTCANCGRQTSMVFYVGSENDNPRWACEMCVMSQKRK